MKARSGLQAIVAFCFGACVLASASHASAQMTTARIMPHVTPAPVNSPTSVTPFVVPSLAPADAPTSLPYPAYGPAVPGIQEGVVLPKVPTVISLKDAVAIAVELSPVLASARADIGIAAAQKRLAAAGLLPSIGISATANHNWFGNRVGSPTNPIGGANSGFSSNFNAQSNSGALTLSQVIYNGGRTVAAIRAARANETAYAATYRRTLQTVAYNVAVAYYNTLAAKRTTQVNLELVRQYEVQQSLVQAQFRAGTVAKVDVITAGVPLAQGRVAVIQAQGSEVSSQAAFANALGLPANTSVRPKDDTPLMQTVGMQTIPIPTFDTALKRAASLRPDLEAQQLAVVVAKYNLKSAEKGLAPTIAANVSQNYSSTNIGGGNFSRQFVAGGTLTLPLFDQGQTPANKAIYTAQLDKANAALQNVVLNLQLNVRQTLAQLVSARAAIYASQVALNQSLEVLKATQAQYRAGVTTLPQLLNSQVQFSQSLTSQLSAVYTLRQAEQAFLYAEGANSL